MPRVSVIVPNYNHARYLPQRIESVLAQTFDDFELIILDDASPDRSREVIDRYAGDPRVRTLFNETNSGNTFRQWDKGLALAKGEYVWIAESDDAAAPDFLERLVKALDDHTSASMAVCNTIVIDEDDIEITPYFSKWKQVGVSDYDLSVFDRDFATQGLEYLRRFMAPWNTIPNASAVLFRRHSLDALEKPPETMRLCGDWLIYARLLKVGDIVRVAAAMNFFREHRVNVRSRYRGCQFIDESMIVQREMANAIGVPTSDLLARIGPSYAHIIVTDLSEGRPLLPISRWPRAVRRGLAIDRSIGMGVAINLLRQWVGGLRKRARRAAS